MISRFVVACIAPAVIAAATFPIGTDAQKPTPVQRAFDRLPLTFEPNRGQTTKEELFVGRNGRYTVSLHRREVVLRTPGAAPLTLRLLGAREPRNLKGISPTGGISSYFAGNRPWNWHTAIPTFHRVRYEGVYKAIDLVFRGTGGNLEYDFIVSPGADPSCIEIMLTGARSLKLGALGDLQIDGEGFSMTQHKPLVFQESGGVRTEISGEYVLLSGNRVRFRIGAFDRTRTLVIDPVLVYSAVVGANDLYAAAAIAVDASGNAYIAGTIGKFGVPAIPVSFHLGIAGISQAYICKLNSTATAIAYCATFNGTDGGESAATGVAVDGQGNAYLTGYTWSRSFPTTPGAFQTGSNGGEHVFVLKLDPTGSTLRYSTYLGGDYRDWPYAIAVDSSGHAFVGGTTESSNFPVTPNAFQPSRAGHNGFVTKLDATGTSLIYSTYIGGSLDSNVRALAVDSAGSAYVTGYTGSYDFPVVPGSFQTSYPSKTSGGAYVSKFDPSGSRLLYSTFLKGALTGTGVAIDSSGSAHVAAWGSSFDVGPMHVFGVSRYDDILAVKLDPAGSALLYATSIGGSWDDFASGIAVDNAGNAWISGWSQSIDFPMSSPVQAISGSVMSDWAAAEQSLIIRLDSQGEMAFSTYLGGRGHTADDAHAVAVDPTGAAYVIGRVSSADFPVTPGALGDFTGQGLDLFVAKFADVSGCTYSLSSASDTFTSAGGEHSVTVNAPAGCNWLAASNQSWLTVNGGLSYVGTGTGAVRVSAEATLIVPRTATLSIAGVAFPVSQGPGCEYTLSSSAGNVSADGGRVAVRLTTAINCPWTISGKPDWISGSNGAPSTGPWDLIFDVQPGPSRTASFTIAGLPFTINQGAAVNCTYVLDRAAATYSSDRIQDTTGVYTGDGCAWTAYTTATWLVISRFHSSYPDNDVLGVGTGGFWIYADSNQDLKPRTATILIGTEKLVVVQASMYTGLAFYPITPCRVVDTRSRPDGPFAGPGIPGGTSRDFAIPNGACGVPATAQAYSLNVGVVPQGRLGFLTVWAAGRNRPGVSTLNSWDGRIKSVGAIVPAGTGGAISVFATDTTHVVLDINGYFVPAAANPSALAYYPLAPCRVLDTRNENGALGGPYLSGNTTRDFPVLSASSCGISSDTQAYSLNVAVVPREHTMRWLTAWPTGQPQPIVATLNDPTGTILSNAALVPAGTGGQVSVSATDDTHFVVDVTGYFAPQSAGGLLLYTLDPCRRLDTRLRAGSSPFSGTLDVGLVCGPPATAEAYVVSATVVPPGVMRWMTLWPAWTTRPLASSLNDTDGSVTNNMALVPANHDVISAFVTDPTHLIIDVFGFFAP